MNQQKKFLSFQYYADFLQELKKVNERIDKNLHLSFVSLLYSYKAFEPVLDGTISYFYRNRNTLWFRKFFPEKELYELVKADIKHHHKNYPNIKLTITKYGTMIYDNYKRNKFNILLITAHAGVWVPKYIKSLMALRKSKRLMEEDIGTDLIYGPLVLDRGGIWIDNKQSRFVCDYNRSRESAVYTNTSEKRVQNIWKRSLGNKQKERILERYDYFYHVLNQLIDTYRFNIIFDAHSMVDEPDRPPFSFGIDFSPRFYYPIIMKMKENLELEVKEEVLINNPFGAGYILEHLAKQFPDVFIFSMEINKKLYMDKKHCRTYKRKVKKLSKNIEDLFRFKKPKGGV